MKKFMFFCVLISIFNGICAMQPDQEELELEPAVPVVENPFPLHLAARTGNWEQLQILVGNGANINFRDVHGRTALIEAAENGQLAAVEYLIQHGADVNVHDNQGNSALRLAFFNQHREIMATLVTNGADYHNMLPIMVLLESIRNHVSQEVLQRVESEILLPALTIDPFPLHLAARIGDWDQVQVLMASGVDINVRDARGRTTLMEAAENGQLAIAEYFVNQGADLNLRDNNGSTALTLAFLNRHREIVALLFTHKADIFPLTLNAILEAIYACVPREVLEQYHWSPERQAIIPPFDAAAFVKKLTHQTRRALASHRHRKHSEMIRAAKKELGKKAVDLADDQIVAIVKASWS